MENSEIIRVFTDIAELLERKKENPFKIRAYRKVVHYGITAGSSGTAGSGKQVR